MTTALTFGVEIEFALAYVPKKHPSPLSHDHRQTRFPTLPSDWTYSIQDTHLLEKGNPSQDREDHIYTRTSAYNNAIIRALRKTLHDAGYPTNPNEPDKTNPLLHLWAVTTDSTITGDLDSEYSFAPIEIISPAYFFSEDAIETVGKVCMLLKNTYCIRTNDSTGLHVHIGNGFHSFPFHTIRNLAAFLWIFEPQLTMLHPEHRHNTCFCCPVRKTAAFSFDEYGQCIKPFTVYEGVIEIIRCQSVEELKGNVYNERFRTYNFCNFSATAGQRGNVSGTLEFRQHEGTLNGEMIAHWVRVCHGIVAFVKDMSGHGLWEMCELARVEIWEETGDKERNERLRKMYGPVLCKGVFTVVDLLERLGLREEAEFYEGVLEREGRLEVRRGTVMSKREREGKSESGRRSSDKRVSGTSSSKIVWEGPSIKTEFERLKAESKKEKSERPKSPYWNNLSDISSAEGESSSDESLNSKGWWEVLGVELNEALLSNQNKP